MHHPLKGKRVLFGTSSWGLGHATRDLVLMRGLLDAGCSLSVVTDGNALRVLQGELGDEAEFLDWPDIPTSVSSTTLGFYAKTVANIPQILSTWVTEKRRLKELLKHHSFDLIVSDHRFGMVTPEIPSYFITHSLRYIAPWRDPIVEATMEGFVARWLSPVRGVFIPDDAEDGLSGDMSHKLRFFPPEKRVYLGMLSSVEERDTDQDIDIFITISGPEPQRTMLQEKILQQLHVLEGRRVVVTLGQPGQEPPPAPPGIEIYSYLDRDRQAEMINRSKLVVCRSGYTTLMELAEVGRRALLIPTPGQTEQLYLGKTLHERGMFYSVEQRNLDLGRDIPRAVDYPGYQPDHPTAGSVEIFLNTLQREFDSPTENGT